MKGNTIEIHSIADINGALAKYLSCIRERHQGIHILIQTMTEYLIYFQFQPLFFGKSHKFLIIWISRNLCNSVDACLFQFFKKAYQPWICILKTTGID